MKLSAISNNPAGFKALYKPNNYNFSAKQQAIVKDIESKLGDRVADKDYCVAPYDNDRVALYKVSNPKPSLVDPKSFRFGNQTLYTVCDEWHPLDIQKLDGAEKTLKDMEKCLDIALKIIIPIAAFATGLAIFLSLKSSNNVAKAQSELVQNFDTLKENLAKNTLDLTKRFNK